MGGFLCIAMLGEEANWNGCVCGLITLTKPANDTAKASFLWIHWTFNFLLHNNYNYYYNLSSLQQLNEQFSNKNFFTNGVKGKWNLNKIMSLYWKREEEEKLIDGICLHRWNRFEEFAIENNFRARGFNKLINLIHNLALLCSHLFNWFRSAIQ